MFHRHEVKLADASTVIFKPEWTGKCSNSKLNSDSDLHSNPNYNSNSYPELKFMHSKSNSNSAKICFIWRPFEAKVQKREKLGRLLPTIYEISNLFKLAISQCIHEFAHISLWFDFGSESVKRLGEYTFRSCGGAYHVWVEMTSEKKWEWAIFWWHIDTVCLHFLVELVTRYLRKVFKCLWMSGEKTNSEGYDRPSVSAEDSPPTIASLLCDKEKATEEYPPQQASSKPLSRSAQVKMKVHRFEFFQEIPVLFINPSDLVFQNIFPTSLCWWESWNLKRTQSLGCLAVMTWQACLYCSSHLTDGCCCLSYTMSVMFPQIRAA